MREREGGSNLFFVNDIDINFLKRECHTPTLDWLKRGGVARDWDSFTCFSDIGGPIAINKFIRK